MRFGVTVVLLQILADIVLSASFNDTALTGLKTHEILDVLDDPANGGKLIQGSFTSRTDADVLNSNSIALCKELDAFRKNIGLQACRTSFWLTRVAQLHVEDLLINAPHIGKPAGVNMHSWSGKGPWKAVDYYGDHRNANGMWSKPSEISGGEYRSNGFEISGAGYTRPKSMIAGWDKSLGHSEVMRNSGIWADLRYNPWKACGCAYNGKYSAIWFSSTTDTTKTTSTPDKGAGGASQGGRDKGAGGASQGGRGAKSCECRGEGAHKHRGVCGEWDSDGTWCYVKNPSNCPDKKESSISGLFWSLSACKGRPKTCECRGKGAHKDRGVCGPWDSDGTWCYVKNPSNCPDKERSSILGLFWSLSACKTCVNDYGDAICNAFKDLCGNVLVNNNNERISVRQVCCKTCKAKKDELETMEINSIKESTTEITSRDPMAGASSDQMTEVVETLSDMIGALESQTNDNW